MTHGEVGVSQPPAGKENAKMTPEIAIATKMCGWMGSLQSCCFSLASLVLYIDVRVITLICEEGGNSSCSTRCIVVHELS